MYCGFPFLQEIRRLDEEQVGILGRRNGGEQILGGSVVGMPLNCATREERSTLRNMLSLQTLSHHLCAIPL